jgi:hypothetical protein
MKLRRKVQYFLPPYKPSTKSTLLDKGFTALIALLTGIVAYIVAPRFAASINKDAYTFQIEAEVSRLGRELFVKRQLGVRTSVDSTIKQMEMTVERGVQIILDNGDTSTFPSRRNQIMDGITQVGLTLELYRSYVDSTFAKRAWLLHEAFRGVYYQPGVTWPSYALLLKAQSEQLSIDAITQYSLPLNQKAGVLTPKWLDLPDATEFPVNFKNKAQRPITYLDSINKLFLTLYDEFYQSGIK